MTTEENKPCKTNEEHIERKNITYAHKDDISNRDHDDRDGEKHLTCHLLHDHGECDQCSELADCKYRREDRKFSSTIFIKIVVKEVNT